MEMKKRLVRDILFSYPNFSENFIIHTDESNTYIREVIIQNGKPTAF